MKVTISIEKAKLIAHQKRRAMRAEEFAPLDEVIMKQIPGTDFPEAESSRQAIRDKYAEKQIQIDSAGTTEELKTILGL
jgi:hypothetical protein